MFGGHRWNLHALSAVHTLSLVPRPHPAFQHFTRKAEGPGIQNQMCDIVGRKNLICAWVHA